MVSCSIMFSFVVRVARGSDRTISNQRKIKRKTGQEKESGLTRSHRALGGNASRASPCGCTCSLQPQRLGKRPVGRDVPRFQPYPHGRWIHGPLEFPPRKLPRVGHLDRPPLHL